MSDDDDDDVHPEHAAFTRLLDSLQFADRYYTYCGAHAKGGPEVPLALQTSALAETGRMFRHNKKEKFFAWRDPKAPEGCELGLNVSLEDASVEWILVFKTKKGHLGSTFANMAADVKHLKSPKYKHNPPYPTPLVASATELRRILDDGLAIYDAIATAIAKHDWR